MKRSNTEWRDNLLYLRETCQSFQPIRVKHPGNPPGIPSRTIPTPVRRDIVQQIRTLPTLPAAALPDLIRQSLAYKHKSGKMYSSTPILPSLTRRRLVKTNSKKRDHFTPSAKSRLTAVMYREDRQAESSGGRNLSYDNQLGSGAGKNLPFCNQWIPVNVRYQQYIEEMKLRERAREAEIPKQRAIRGAGFKTPCSHMEKSGSDCNLLF